VKTEFLARSLKGSSGSSGDRRGEGTTHTRPSVSSLFSLLLSALSRHLSLKTIYESR
jgi:hypothetical protein